MNRLLPIPGTLVAVKATFEPVTAFSTILCIPRNAGIPGEVCISCEFTGSSDSAGTGATDGHAPIRFPELWKNAEDGRFNEIVSSF